MAHPKLWQTVLDGPDPRALAEFYRRLLGLQYRPGDEPPTDGRTDVVGQNWLVLRDPSGRGQLAFQVSPGLPRATWPAGPTPQQLHLDIVVESVAELNAQHDRALELGATLLDGSRADDPEEPLRVYADPAGHPFCLFVRTPD